MKRQELIQQYCQLREATARILFEQTGDSRARDCFCMPAPHRIVDLQDEVFEFIRASVAIRFEMEACAKYPHFGHKLVQYYGNRGAGADFNKLLGDIVQTDLTNETLEREDE